MINWTSCSIASWLRCGGVGSNPDCFQLEIYRVSLTGWKQYKAQMNNNEIAFTKGKVSGLVKIQSACESPWLWKTSSVRSSRVQCKAFVVAKFHVISFYRWNIIKCLLNKLSCFLISFSLDKSLCIKMPSNTIHKRIYSNKYVFK